MRGAHFDPGDEQVACGNNDVMHEQGPVTEMASARHDRGRHTCLLNALTLPSCAAERKHTEIHYSGARTRCARRKLAVPRAGESSVANLWWTVLSHPVPLARALARRALAAALGRQYDCRLSFEMRTGQIRATIDGDLEAACHSSSSDEQTTLAGQSPRQWHASA